MRQPWKQMLPVKLLEHEMLEAGQRLSHAITKLDKVKARKAKYNKLIKERVDRADAEVHSLNDTLKSGEEMREVMCTEEVSIFEKKIRLRRLDTYEVYKERDMEPNELQQEIRYADESAGNMASLDAAIDRDEQNVLPFIATPAPAAADVRAAAEAAGVTEEQAAADTPEEAEAMRQARLEAEERERGEEEDPADDPGVDESPESRRLRVAGIATQGREDMPSEGDGPNGEPF